MKIFSKEEFVNFVRNDDMIYIDNVDLNSEDNSFDYDMKIVNDVVDENGVYSLMFGSRGEVEFVKVNLVDELVEWNELSMSNEFCYLCGNWNEEELDRDNDLLELGFDEEDWRYYFTIVKKKSWFEIKNLV